MFCLPKRKRQVWLKVANHTDRYNHMISLRKHSAMVIVSGIPCGNDVKHRLNCVSVW